jgi:hypothetical protein
MRLSLLGMWATNWPIIPAPDDRWKWNSWWNENWQGTLKYLEETCPSVTLSTENTTWPDLVLKLGSRCGKLVTNCPSYGTAYCQSLGDCDKDSQQRVTQLNISWNLELYIFQKIKI